MPATITTRIFETPELWGLICHHSSRATCATLMRINRSSFRDTAPYLWKNIDNVGCLLNLIPGATRDNPEWEWVLPNLSEVDLSRFSIYAYHVQFLQVGFRLRSWKSLVTTPQQRPLLLQLIHLQVHYFHDHPEDVIEAITWMSILLIPSTTWVELGSGDDLYHPGIISNNGLFSVLHTITTLCPHVDKLALPGCLLDQDSDDKEHSLFSLLSSRPIYQHFTAFTKLHELTAGLWIFQPELVQNIASLPRLRCLNIIEGGGEVQSPITLQPDPFPTLENITFDLGSCSDVPYALGYPLGRRLVSLKIWEFQAEHGWGPILGIFLALRNMPELTILDLRFHFYPEDFDSRVGRQMSLHTRSTILQTLSQLPLRVFRIDGIEFPNFSQIEFEKILLAVEELRMPDQTINLGDLAYLARIPDLNHLCIKFWNDDSPRLNIHDPVCSTLHTLELDLAHYERQVACSATRAHDIARFILKLFPNIKRVNWDRTSQNDAAHFSIALLNTCIASIRSWDQARIRVTEAFGPEAAVQLLSDDNDLRQYQRLLAQSQSHSFHLFQLKSI
ncbi:hypothetical protein FRC12_017767 [Ceratobasidium sp. 428]|nr:hypothetical protein FRC12_017767 [Ceratobasidium sp. 428]